MRLATVEVEGAQILVAEDEITGKLVSLAEAGKEYGYSIPETMIEFITAGENLVKQAAETIEKARNSTFLLDKESVRWLAPIPRPAKNIFCVGKNYAEHAIEMGSKADIPEHVMMFTKAPTTVIGHGEAIPNHLAVTNQLDYEGELAIVIGKKAKGVKKKDAEDFIFGYTIINDVSARNLQFKHQQWYRGKSLDGYTPMGPCIVTADEIKDAHDLDICCYVNNEKRQESNTKNMITSVEEAISELSRGCC